MRTQQDDLCHALHRVRDIPWRHKSELEGILRVMEGIADDEPLPKSASQELNLLLRLRHEILRTPSIVYSLDLDRESRLTSRQRLHRFLEDTEGQASLIYARVYVVIMLLGIVPLIVKSFPGCSIGVKNAMSAFEIVLIAVFTSDFVVRAVVAPSRRLFFRRIANIVSVLMIACSIIYVAIPENIQGLSVLSLVYNLLPLYRLVLAMRIFAVSQLLYKSIAGSIQPLMLVLYWLIIMVYFFATLLYFFGDRASYPDIYHSFYQSLFTAKGVGYQHPSTRFGSKIFSTILIITCSIFIAVPLKLTGSYLWQVVNHRDVVDLITACQKKFSHYGFSEDNIKLIYRSMDRKRNGYVSFDEFAEFCRIVGCHRSHARVVDMFKEFDPKNLGYINVAGFTTGVVKSGYKHRYEILKSLQKEAALERTVMRIESDHEQLETMIRKRITTIHLA
jgi:hypothetical protein